MAEPILYISPSDGGKGINMTSGTRLLKFWDTMILTVRGIRPLLY